MSNSPDRIFFTSDLHLGHENIIKHCFRPFATIEENDQVLIDNINKVVGPSDTLYCLGDFALAHAWSSKSKLTEARIREYRDRINCRNITLIVGNHDPHTKDGEPQKFLFSIFNGKVHRMLNIHVNDNGVRHKIVLCHYAMTRWHSSHRGSYCLYGHSHYGLPDDPNSMSFDVGVDAVAGRATGLVYPEIKEQRHLLKPSEYRPLSFVEVQAIIKAKPGYRPPNNV